MKTIISMFGAGVAATVATMAFVGGNIQNFLLYVVLGIMCIAMSCDKGE